MDTLLLFFSGAFFANSIPHFINGISGRVFVKPFLYRFVSWIPNHLFNTLWGILWISVSIVLLNLYLSHKNSVALKISLNFDFIVFCLGFVTVSLFLSAFFARGGWQR